MCTHSLTRDLVQLVQEHEAATSGACRDLIRDDPCATEYLRYGDPGWGAPVLLGVNNKAHPRRGPAGAIRDVERLPLRDSLRDARARLIERHQNSPHLDTLGGIAVSRDVMA
jgi:hypothetical protein